jgi:hypothetical protein
MSHVPRLDPCLQTTEPTECVKRQTSSLNFRITQTHGDVRHIRKGLCPGATDRIPLHTVSVGLHHGPIAAGPGTVPRVDVLYRSLRRRGGRAATRAILTPGTGAAIRSGPFRVGLTKEKRDSSRRVLVKEHYEAARLVRDEICNAQLPAGRSCSTVPSCIVQPQQLQAPRRITARNPAPPCTSVYCSRRLQGSGWRPRWFVRFSWWACAFKISRCASCPLLAASFAPAS